MAALAARPRSGSHRLGSALDAGGGRPHSERATLHAFYGALALPSGWQGRWLPVVQCEFRNLRFEPTESGAFLRAAFDHPQGESPQPVVKDGVSDLPAMRPPSGHKMATTTVKSTDRRRLIFAAGAGSATLTRASRTVRVRLGAWYMAAKVYRRS